MCCGMTGSVIPVARTLMKATTMKGSSGTKAENSELESFFMR